MVCMNVELCNNQGTQHTHTQIITSYCIPPPPPPIWTPTKWDNRVRQYGCMQDREGLLTDNKVNLIEGQDSLKL